VPSHRFCIRVSIIFYVFSSLYACMYHSRIHMSYIRTCRLRHSGSKRAQALCWQSQKRPTTVSKETYYSVCTFRLRHSGSKRAQALCWQKILSAVCCCCCPHLPLRCEHITHTNNTLTHTHTHTHTHNTHKTYAHMYIQTDHKRIYRRNTHAGI